MPKSKCLFPDHHGKASDNGGGLGLVAVIVVIVAAAAVAAAVSAAVQFVTAHAWWFITAAAVLAAARLGPALTRFAFASPAARRNYPRAWWARLRWRWFCRNQGLAYLDRARRRLLRPRMPASTAVRVDPAAPARMRWPRAKFRADAYGITATVKTIPKVGRAELEQAVQHLADHWRCTRVQVAQRKPGRLTVRGLRTDPLTLPLPAAVLESSKPWRPYLGRDEWGTDRHLDLSGITGVTVGGLPGYGKTSLVLELLDQLAGSPAVQFAFIDGKGGGDYADWHDRAWLSVGDDLETAAATFEDVHGLMRKRLAVVGTDGSPRNRWHIGPTEDWPLIVTIVDEAHSFYDLDAVKGDRQAEPYVRTCRALTAQLVKKGRSVLFLTILITQKQTSDAIPTAIRDICSVGFSFATRTTDAAVAALGEGIRGYPSYCPTRLQARPDYIGVCTASMPTGSDPFVRLRVPEVTQEAAAARAAETAHLHRDPAAALDTPAPALVPVPELEAAAAS